MSQENTPKPVLNPEQQKNLDRLRLEFGLSQAALDRCRFFDNANEPWIPPDILQAIANEIDRFTYTAVKFDKYIRELEQCIWMATVIDDQGKTFDRPGVATIGEASGAEETDGLNIDAHLLAQGRALQAALGAAGFHPFKPGYRVKANEGVPSHTGQLPTEREIELQRKADESALRGKDLRQIHALAEECGLIIGNDRRNYRRWLKANYGVETAALMTAGERASVINALSQITATDDAYLREIPLDLIADAMIA